MKNKIYNKSVFKIICEHFFTLFNALNIILAILVIYFDSLKNVLFMGVVICNTLIGIMQELYARNILKKLTVLAKRRFNLANNTTKDIDEIVKHDCLKVEIGDQIVFEGILKEGNVVVDESFITGESDYITKNVGDKLLSGSFVVSGSGILEVMVVGKDNFIYKIMTEGKKIKKVDSEIVKSLKKIIKVISIIIVPLSILIFYKQYYILHSPVNRAVINTVASILGMIPEGLILLTSTVAALSIIKLNKYNVLIQNLYATELLARTEIICFDKTGTLTTGEIKLEKFIAKSSEAEEILNTIVSVSKDNNKTMLALKTKFKGKSIKYDKFIPFDSKKKCSEIIIANKKYRLGAPTISNYEVSEYQNNYRVLTLEEGTNLLAILVFSDELRQNIKNVIAEYQKENIKITIISGDDINTITNIARISGINDIRGVDVSKEKDIDYSKLVSKYNIFGRVKPEEKRLIVAELKKLGITTYVGDGVNDVLALKEANTSITFLNASTAAKSVAEVILLDSNFEVLPKVIHEGRKITGNIERSASLFLSKTIYAMLLTILFLFVKESYPFIPIQISLIGATTIGIPGFILALEASNDEVTKNFLKKIFKNALPAGLTVAVNIILLLIINKFFKFSNLTFTTLSLLLTETVGFLNLAKISIPFTKVRKILFISLVLLFLVQFIFLNSFYGLEILDLKNTIIVIILMIISVFIFKLMNKMIEKLFKYSKIIA